MLVKSTRLIEILEILKSNESLQSYKIYIIEYQFSQLISIFHHLLTFDIFVKNC